MGLLSSQFPEPSSVVSIGVDLVIIRRAVLSLCIKSRVICTSNLRFPEIYNATIQCPDTHGFPVKMFNNM
jgi:hypothetical protein